MYFLHCPECASPVREGRLRCSDCGARMPHPDLVAVYNGRPLRRPPRRRPPLHWLHWPHLPAH